MKCYHCEHYDNKTDICDVDGKVVINPWSDAECDYLKEPETVFDRLTQSPEALAEKLVYQLPDGWWVATIVYDGAKFTHKETAIAATVARLKEVYNGN